MIPRMAGYSRAVLIVDPFFCCHIDYKRKDQPFSSSDYYKLLIEYSYDVITVIFIFSNFSQTKSFLVNNTRPTDKVQHCAKTITELMQCSLKHSITELMRCLLKNCFRDFVIDWAIFKQQIIHSAFS